MNNINKKINEMFGKMDEKVMKMKIAEALNMMKSGKQDELIKKLDKVDKKEVLEKLKDVDEKTIRDLNINIQDIRKNISDEDFRKFKNATDDDGKKIIDKIKKLIDE